MELPSRPSLDWETQSGFPSRLVAGVDEVGRGCLAGPVVTAAVILPASVLDSRPEWLGEVTDSKLVKPERRTELASLIRGWARSYSIASATVEEIDSLNIHHATLLAMARAAESLEPSPEWLLVDGKFAPPAWRACATTVVKGDLRSLSIACASILAKVHRDEWMVRLDGEYPGYSFAGHKGYFTPVHRRALTELGPCALHRRSFAPVTEALSRG